MKRKSIFSLLVIIVAVIVVAGFLLCSFTTLEKRIGRLVDTSNGWKVKSIEKMMDNGSIDVKDVKTDIEQYDQLITIIKNTDLRRLKREIGMEVDDVLYTFTVVGNDEYSSVTVNSNGKLHLNKNDVTYVIRNDHLQLYDALEDLYNESK